VSLSTIAGLPIQKVTDNPPFFNMLVYGESGVGKTTLAGSADEVPEMRKVLFIDIEGGTLSIRKKFPDVEVVRVRNWPELQTVYDELYAGLHDYSTIVIDSLTEAQKMSMDTVMKKLVMQYEDRDADVPGIREWNINIEQTRKFVRLFRDLPVNTVFTTLCKTDKNINTGAIRRKPSLSGKVSDEVAGFLDIVTYLYTKEEPSTPGSYIRVLLCGNTESEVAKDRTDLLPLTIPNPTMAIIWNAVKGLNTNERAA
jgi:AAA domain